MAYTPGNPGTKLDNNFENDLLALADTKLVLGNWYAECVMNGRSLPDFAAILGMCTSNYGHTESQLSPSPPCALCGVWCWLLVLPLLCPYRMRPHHRETRETYHLQIGRFQRPRLNSLLPFPFHV